MTAYVVGRQYNTNKFLTRTTCQFASESGSDSSQKKILKRKKYLSLRRIFVEYKNEEKTQNFSKETTIAAISDMLTSREKSAQEKSIMLDQETADWIARRPARNVGNFTTKWHSFAEKNGKKNNE